MSRGRYTFKRVKAILEAYHEVFVKRYDAGAVQYDPVRPANRVNKGHPDGKILIGMKMDIDRALNFLPEKFYHPVYLFYIENQDYDEICPQLGVSHVTFYDRLWKGVNELAEILNSLEERKCS